jgi:hypothetical protein
MSFTGDIGIYGPGSNARFMAGSTRGRMQNATYGMSYPSPFFDIAHTWLPQTMKDMFKWCRYYFMTSPLINTVGFKLSEYAITDIIVEHESKKVQKLWEEYIQDHLRCRSFQIECGLDYHVYGNCVVSIKYPLDKYLKCTNCGFSDKEDVLREKYIYTNNSFRLRCPKCENIGPAKVIQYHMQRAGDINLVRWNPEDIDISYNEITGERIYYYNIPAMVRSDVTVGKKHVVAEIPQLFLEAIKKNKSVTFSKDALFHLHRPNLAGKDRGWGTPLLLPVLKDAYYLQIMKKAQECVAPNTLIETSTGLRPASEVAVGDFVRSHTGALRTVSGRSVRPMVEERGDYAVKLSVSGLRQLASTFSDNHPMWVLKRNGKNRRKDTPDMRRSSYVLRNMSLYEFGWKGAGEVVVGDYIGYPTSRNRECSYVDMTKYVDMVGTDKYVYSGVSSDAAKAYEALEDGCWVPHDNPGRVAKAHVRKGTTPKRAPRYTMLEDLAYIAGWYMGDGSIGARRVDFSMGPDDDGVELQQAIEDVFGGGFGRYPSKKSRGWILSAC